MKVTLSITDPAVEDEGKCSGFGTRPAAAQVQLENPPRSLLSDTPAVLIVIEDDGTAMSEVSGSATTEPRSQVVRVIRFD